MTGKVVHFEIPADNMERAQKFYKDTFQWTINSMPEMGYALVGGTPANSDGMLAESGSINGGMLLREEPVKHPVITISVESIDETEKQIQKNGGKLIRKKMPVGDMGFASYFQDTEGNVVGLWESAK